jgi:hypothetical protein
MVCDMGWFLALFSLFTSTEDVLISMIPFQIPEVLHTA